jgi:hypothetical protein
VPAMASIEDGVDVANFKLRPKDRQSADVNIYVMHTNYISGASIQIFQISAMERQPKRRRVEPVEEPKRGYG